MKSENIVKHNLIKKSELIRKISECDGNYKLICIDVDDVVFDMEPLMQKVLASIDFRATNKYRVMMANDSSEDSRDASIKSFAILDAILEEKEYVEYDEDKDRIVRKNYHQIDYDALYDVVEPLPGSIDYINNMLDTRDNNTFYIFLSHRNPEREGIAKLKKLYELFPNIDAIETLPFHIPGTKDVNSKANYIMQTYGLSTLENCYLIDNSKKNCLDFRQKGGTDIRFLPNGYGSGHVRTDHVSKLACLDPTMIAFCLSYIRYARENPNCYLEKLSKGEIPTEVQDKTISKILK